MAKVKDNLLVKLLLGIVVGIVLGLFVNEPMMMVIATIKEILGQLIFLCVPLIIIGFITPAITDLKSSATKMLGVTLLL